MRKLKLYLETSVFNFVFAEDSPDERDVTLKFFDCLNQYEPYISEVVIAEINRTPKEEKKQQLFNLISKYNLEQLPFDEPSKVLANRYIQEGIIPQSYQEDAFHIAIASVNNLDALISWNFAHIVKLKTKREVVGINAIMGYKEIEIYSPWEVVENV